MQIGCSKSTISREMSRNGGKEKYSIVNAQNRYQQKRKKCRKPRILSEESLRRLVIKYIVIILLLGVNFKSSKKLNFFTRQQNRFHAIIETNILVTGGNFYVILALLCPPWTDLSQPLQQDPRLV